MSKFLTFAFGLGVLLSSIPGLFPQPMHLLSTLSLLLGASALVGAAMINGYGRPESAVLLLLTSNLSFWLSFGLWHLRLRAAGPSPSDGIETFAGTLAVWCLLLAAFSLYESVVCLRGFMGGNGRSIAVAGIAGLVVQTLTSLRIAYNLVQGV